MIPFEISEYELFLNKKNIELLKQLSNKEITSENKEPIIEMLDKLFIYFFYCKYQDSFDEIYRITINKKILKANKRIKNIKDLKYPPDCKLITTYGRCNLRHQKILYASLMRMTSLGELKPQVGDLITESTWQLKSTKPLTIIPIFSNQPTNKPFVNTVTGEVISGLTNIRTYELDIMFKNHTEDYPKNLKELGHLVVQFISDCFAKPVNSANHWNYIFSAYFADKFLNKIEDGNIDAIYYPSVPDKLNSENLAIKPKVFDELYRLSEVQESIVSQDPSDGRGGYKMHQTASCKNFNYATNEIIWDYEKYNQSDDFVRYLMEKYDVDLN